MSPTVPSCFATSFDNAVREALVVGLERAYATAADIHVPTRGSNEATFGFSLYHFAVHELCAEATAMPGQMQVQMRSPMFRVNIGDYRVACHRVGTSEHSPIESSFPGNESAAHTLVETQLWLEGFEEGLVEARSVIIGHMGNPTDGLCAAYICIPRRTENSRIVEWAYTECIWRRGAGQDFQGGPAPIEPPPPEPIPDVVVVPRAREERRDA